MAVLGFLAFALNTFVHAVVAFYVVLLLKLLGYPIPAWRRLCDRWLIAISRQWTVFNAAIFRTFMGLKLEPSLAPGIELSREKRYLIVANHQSWVDIFVMHALFHPRTPFLTFFLKKQLIWVPFFGVIWWTLGFPFMKRHSSAYLEQHPEKRGEDLKTTRRLCASLKGRPYAIINFVEGTRRTHEKAKKSPYQHLLAPKAGGIATALEALDYEFDHILDVTIAYTTPRHAFGDLLAGRVGRVVARIAEIPLSEVPKGDYFQDEAHAARFREWLNAWWKRKDAVLGAMKEGDARAA